MRWKNMKIGMKLGMGFGVVLVLLMIISGYSYLGFSKVDHLTHEVVVYGEGNEFMLEKQIDHLNWVATLSDLIFKDSVTSVQLETDDHKCGFGKWLYGEDVKKLTAKPMWPSILRWKPFWQTDGSITWYGSKIWAIPC